MIECPGCGGRNPREALSCEWCRRPFFQTHRRGLSARWWGLLSGVIIAVLLLLVSGLALLNAMRAPGRPVTAVPTASPPPLLPLQVASPPPAATPSSAPATPSPAPLTPTPPPTPTTAAAQYARIANTGGLGANLRREPATSAPPITAVAENAVVRLVGPEQRAADGRVWRLVEDSRGMQGWVPADFLVETTAPPGR